MAGPFYRIQDGNLDVHDLLDPDVTSTSMVNDDVRRGKSVMRSVEDLAKYVANNAIEWGNDPVLVELDGRYSPDTDLDASQGVELVYPEHIRSVARLRA